MSSRFPSIVTMVGAVLGATALQPGSAQATPPALERPAAAFHPPPTHRPPPPDDPADTCAVVPEVAPDFQLEDVNPTSPTYGALVDRTQTPGDVTMLYIALASCGHCQADTDRLGELVDAQGTAWSEVSVRVIALDAALESLPELADGHDLPILVDTPDVDIEGRYGADRWYLYILDRSGLPRHLHYEPDFSGEQERLIDQVATLLAEDRP